MPMFSGRTANCKVKMERSCAECWGKDGELASYLQFRLSLMPSNIRSASRARLLLQTVQLPHIPIFHRLLGVKYC